MKPETQTVPSQINQMVIFKVADEIFATNINSIREVIKLVEITPVPNSHDYIKGIINIRGKIVPVMDLGIVLKIGSHVSKDSNILLIDAPDNAMVGVIVDEVSEIRSFKSDEIKPAPKMVKSKVESEFIAGVILPTNSTDQEKVILFVDLEAIINKSVAGVIDQIKSAQEETKIINKETP